MTIDMSTEAVIPKNKDLSEISEIAEAMKNMQGFVADLENKLAINKERLRNIQETILPEAMQKVGLSEFKLSDGSKIVIKVLYKGSIPKGKEEIAFSWLKEHGHEDLIKNSISTSFGKGEEQRAEQCCNILQEAGYDYTNKKSVHPSTLKAFVREQIEAGRELPLDILGVFILTKAEIK